MKYILEYNNFDNSNEESIIKDKTVNDGIFMKAPNGKKTNLTEKQWLQVRTPEFKKWFGDWENDPENSSKVVDENVEPKVVYHGIINWNEDSLPFTSFDIKNDSKRGGNFNLSLGAGAYFSPDKEGALKFSGYYLKRNQIEDGTYGIEPDGLFSTFYPQLYEVFLNIKNPAYDNVEVYTKTTQERERKGFDGIIHSDEIVVNYPNQIKSATNNNGDFNPNDKNINK